MAEIKVNLTLDEGKMSMMTGIALSQSVNKPRALENLTISRKVNVPLGFVRDKSKGQDLTSSEPCVCLFDSKPFPLGSLDWQSCKEEVWGRLNHLGGKTSDSKE